GSLYPYSKNVNIYKCPADKKVVTFSQGSGPTTRSMSMNAWLDPIVRPDTAASKVEPLYSYKKLADILRPPPVSCWVFIEECPGSINDGFFVCDPDYMSVKENSLYWVDIPATYHNGAGGISFADGHAEIRKWTDPAVTFQPNAGFIKSRQDPPADLI